MTVDELRLEAELHEVRDRIRLFELDRREFLRLCGGGLLVCAAGAGALVAQESGRNFGGHQLPQEVSAWIHIDADGKVTVFTGKVEIGQNIRTSLAQSVAEELSDAVCLDHDDDGRYGSGAVGYGDVREPIDADDGAAAADDGDDGAGNAD